MRRCLQLLTTTSVLLLVAVTVLWVRSYSRSDVVFHSHPKGVAGCGSAKGALVLWRGEINQANVWNQQDGTRFESREPATWDDFKPARLPLQWQIGGFGYKAGVAYLAHWGQVRIPFWPVAALLLVLPSIGARARVIEHRSARRRSNGLCAVCGYDLRACPDRCSECGATAFT